MGLQQAWWRPIAAYEADRNGFLFLNFPGIRLLLNIKSQPLIEFYNKFFSQTLELQNYMQNFGSKYLQRTLKFNYSVYFLKGNDSRVLDIPQQLEISTMIANDNLSSSCLVYNPNEAQRKVAQWKKALPWIHPHYAVKSNPCEMLLSDFAQKGAGMDCASKAEIISSL